MADQLRVLQFNANHDSRATDLALAVAGSQHCDIILLSDPYSYRGRIQAPGWNFILKDRVAALVRHRLKYSEVAVAHQEAVGVNVSGRCLISIYSPPRGNLHDVLMESVEAAKATGAPFVIAGDLNCSTSRIEGRTTNERGEILEDVMDLFALELHNTAQITRSRSCVRGEEQSILDYTLSSAQVQVSGWKVLPDDSLSDHKLIRYDVHTSVTVQREKLLVKKTDPEKLLAAVRELDLPLIDPEAAPPDIDMYVDSLAQALQGAVNLATSVSAAHSGVRWWTPELGRLQKAVNRAGNLARRAKDPLRRLVLITLRNSIRKIYRQAIQDEKAYAWRNFINQRKAWGPAYRVMTKKRAQQCGASVIITDDNRKLLTTQEQAEYLMDAKFPSDADPAAVQSIELSGSFGPARFVSRTAIADIVKSLDNRKAPGLDEITNKAVKTLHRVHPAVLEALFNCCVQAGHFPTPWKLGKAVMLPKPEKDPLRAEGYRPLTLLPTMGKVLERVIAEELREHLDVQTPLNDRQYGFRRNRSCEEAVNEAVRHIRRLLDKYTMVAVVSLDIKGAFDHARWSDILQQLQSRNTPHWILRILRSYFTDRKITLHELWKELSRGCPQGSVLGPLLWLVLFDDALDSTMEDEWYEWAINQLFADDMLVIVAANCTEDLRARVRMITDAVIRFLNTRQLELSVQKTDIIVLDTRYKYSKQHDRCSSLNINGVEIRRSASLKYLGVILDDTLSWDPHIEYIVAKCQKYIPALTAICHNTFGYSSAARRTMYLGTVGALLRYCCSLFYHRLSTTSNQKKIRRLERTIAINTARLYSTCGHSAALAIAGYIPFDLLLTEVGVLWQLRHYGEADHIGHLPSVPAHRVVEAPMEKTFRLSTMRVWQERWFKSKYGKWSQEVIPDLFLRMMHDLPLDFWLSQALSGHGCFRRYLFVRRKTSCELCPTCKVPEDARHVIRACPRFADVRPRGRLNVFDVEHQRFMRSVVRQLWQEERVRAGLPACRL